MPEQAVERGRLVTGDPVLHLLAGPNGSGKSTFFDQVLAPVTGLTFVNADLIAAERWPGDTSAHAYLASNLAAEARDRLLAAGASFATETVFSHPSKLDLVVRARDLGYLVTLYVVLVPVELSVARVAERVAHGGHPVPEGKVRERYDRLWAFVAEAIALAEEVRVFDNSRASPAFRPVATYRDGLLVRTPAWPTWTPEALQKAGRP